MISTRLSVPETLEELFEGLSDSDITEILTQAAEGFSGPDGVLQKHWERGQADWRDPQPAYKAYKAKKHGSGSKFVKTGAALQAIQGGTSPYKVIKVRRGRSGQWSVEVSLVRMEGGKNVYSIAQAAGRGAKGPMMMISENQPGDLELMRPHVEQALAQLLSAKGLL